MLITVDQNGDRVECEGRIEIDTKAKEVVAERVIFTGANVTIAMAFPVANLAFPIQARTE